MQTPLYSKYIKLHPDFLEGLNQPIRERFELKLKQENQKINFLSIISELKFAQFFQQENFQYTYEPKIDNNKTPDFGIVIEGNLIYCDIKRFNIPEKNQHDDELMSELCAKLKSISKPYYVDVQQLKDRLNIDVDLAFNEIRKWFNLSSVALNDSYIYKDEIEVTVVSVNGKSDHILYLYNSSDPIIHPLKMKSDVIQKLKSYRESIIERNFPFVVGIDLRFDTLKDPQDYWILFSGGSCEDLDTGAPSFLLGEFFNDTQLNGLTGLLIRYNEKFYWLKNPRNRFNLDFKNVEREYKLIEVG